LNQIGHIFTACTQPEQEAGDEVSVGAIERFRVQMVSHDWVRRSHTIYGPDAPDPSPQ
jgi:hypothetical protein